MRRFILVLFAGILSACGSVPATGGGGTAQPTQSPAALTCTSAGTASASWPKAWEASDKPAITAAETSGDTLKLTFVSGTPEFSIQQQPDAKFVQDASGQPVVLKGAAGVRIVLRGFRGDLSNYNGPDKLSSAGPLLLEASNIGDFEGVVSFGAGVSAPACANVTATDSSLTFRFVAAH
jgi:hypothetical protein